MKSRDYRMICQGSWMQKVDYCGPKETLTFILQQRQWSRRGTGFLLVVCSHWSYWSYRRITGHLPNSSLCKWGNWGLQQEQDWPKTRIWNQAFWLCIKAYSLCSLFLHPANQSGVYLSLAHDWAWHSTSETDSGQLRKEGGLFEAKDMKGLKPGQVGAGPERWPHGSPMVLRDNPVCGPQF